MSNRVWYFVSDVHLGLDYNNPRERERKFASFLNSLPQNTEALYLLGDIFDFWYEYKDVIPRGYTRVLGALASVVDRGIKVYFFNGNHDIWTYNYLEQEVGVEILKQPYVVDIATKRFCLGHGDGLGCGDLGYKFLRGCFANRFLQVLFSSLHPRIAFSLGNSWSKKNRLEHERRADKLSSDGVDIPYRASFKFKGADERIVKFSEQFQSEQLSKHLGKIDYFIFGHLHYRINYPLKNGGELFILGEWIHTCDYLVFDGQNLISKDF